MNLAQPRGKGYAAVNPRKNETLHEFRRRVPGAVPATYAQRLDEADRDKLAKRLRESAIAIRNGAARLHDWSTSSLREAVASGEIVENVLLIRSGPGNPADGHYYSADCLEQAAATGIFEGAQCYLDHSSLFEEKNRPERSVRHLAGWYSDVKAKAYHDPVVGACTGLFAVFHPAIDKPEVTSIVRTCVEYAKRYPRKAYAGLSISALGDGEPDEIDGRKYLRVDKITAVESVDIVTRAGAGGAIVPLREGFRVKAHDDISLTLDEDKVREGLAKITESQKTKMDAFLKKLKIGESALELNDDQKKELGEIFGLTEGDAIDKVLEDATGLVEGGKKAGADGNDDEDENDDDDDELDEAGEMDEADPEKMSPAELKAAVKKERSLRKAAEKKVKEAQRKVKEAARDSERADFVVRERLADNVIGELNIPERFRPRLKQELLERNYSTEKKMREHAKAFDLAYIRGDGAGNGSGFSLTEGGSKKLTLDFTE